MARLILLNGPPACGKSTLARRFADEHPLTLDLDLDRVLVLLGGWREDFPAAGRAARDLALAMARTHLTAGHDVIVPQFLGRPDFIERLERLAAETGAAWHEIVLTDSRENTLRRFAARTRRAESPDHLHAQQMLDRAGGPAELAAQHDRLAALIATRPAARLVSSVDGEPEATYRRLLAALA